MAAHEPNPDQVTLPARVVLIDDDRVMAAMLSTYLQGEGLTVTHAETGAGGLRLACEPDTSVVLLDVILPDKNGLDVLRELRSRSRVPVIMLTMQGAVADRVQGLESGADDYIPKPFTPIEVLARIRSLLRRTSVVASDVSRFIVDDLILIPASRTALKLSQVVACTTSEFEVLEVLIRNLGSVVTKEELTRSALGRTSYAGDRGVDNLIHSLRRKLGVRTDGGDRFKAFRSVGYMYLAASPADAAEGSA